jgi:hypothetical protein
VYDLYLLGRLALEGTKCNSGYAYLRRQKIYQGEVISYLLVYTLANKDPRLIVYLCLIIVEIKCGTDRVDYKDRNHEECTLTHNMSYFNASH